jgi:hypothetical protein
MIITENDFDEETAWETTVLALAVPVMPLVATGADLDLRTNAVAIQLSGVASGNAVEELQIALLPSLFGAAWKILDLALEFALSSAGLAPQNKTRWRIDEKSSHAVAHNGRLSSFTTSSKIWQAFESLYDRTREVRHALVHRRIKVDPSNHELTGFDTNGIKVLALSYDEQMAFCRSIQRLREAIIERVVRPRVEAGLRDQLMRLKRHHGITMMSAGSTLATGESHRCSS